MVVYHFINFLVCYFWDRKYRRQGMGRKYVRSVYLFLETRNVGLSFKLISLISFPWYLFRSLISQFSPFPFPWFPPFAPISPDILWFPLISLVPAVKLPYKLVFYALPDHVWIHPSKWRLWYQKNAPIFLITPVKLYVALENYKQKCSKSSDIVITNHHFWTFAIHIGCKL